ncbi:hypothetical protein DM01DRAFT_1343138 [Hesseltinella vesiculosa]|uniref:Uncharacterized protein n=1 Tax=Hesseltinella vesiculosa TaxID=101127 RepID=A0A1X2GT72_9FUNG|nr:hypothetical protein DM01DRAFT_1343138 [Hesseltinella vesiculosa]
MPNSTPALAEPHVSSVLTNNRNHMSPVKFQEGQSLSRSYAQAANSNMDKVPLHVKSHMKLHPTYDEDQLMMASSQREARKWKQLQNSGMVDQMTPEMQKYEAGRTDEAMPAPTQAQYENASSPPKDSTSRFTIFNTIAVLRNNGYSWLRAISWSILVHACYSLRTSPFGLPRPYRTLRDFLALPIYPCQLKKCLVGSELLLLHQNKAELTRTVDRYGCKKGKVSGLAYQDGMTVLRDQERYLPWWQVTSRLAHRLQWTLIYMALEDPHTKLVSASSLLSKAQ